jgi:hypothetical protein
VLVIDGSRTRKSSLTEADGGLCAHIGAALREQAGEQIDGGRAPDPAQRRGGGGSQDAAIALCGRGERAYGIGRADDAERERRRAAHLVGPARVGEDRRQLRYRGGIAEASQCDGGARFDGGVGVVEVARDFLRIRLAIAFELAQRCEGGIAGNDGRRWRKSRKRRRGRGAVCQVAACSHHNKHGHATQKHG